MSATANDDSDAGRPRRRWGRVLLLPLVLAIGIFLVFALHLQTYLSFEALAAHRHELLAQVAQHRALTIAVFALVYAAAVALSFPGSSILTMAAGFMFGLVWGTGIAVVAATLGATLLFLVARTSFGEIFRGRAKGALERLKAGFARDALSYLLFLRLVPLFPFWLINLVAALLEVRFITFVTGTFIGIIPGAAVYAGVGSGLGTILDRGQRPDLRVILSPPILVPILALALLSMVPVLVRRLRRKD